MDKIKYIRKYNRLTLQDRKNIERYYKEGLNYTEIGNKIGKDRRTISREIKRNGISNMCSHRHKNRKSHRYFANKANESYLKRKNVIYTGYKFRHILDYYRSIDENEYNIQQIYSDFRMKFPDEQFPTLKTIYNWYHQRKLPSSFKIYRKLRKTKPMKKKRAQWNPKKKHIEIRNIQFNMKEFGHFEIDTLYSSKDKTCVLSFNEISSGKYWARKIPNRKAETTIKALMEVIIEIGVENIKTITSDNGVEFSLSNLFEEWTNIPWFYCSTYASYQRGQNERTNRDLRKFFPKKTNFKKILQTDINIAVEKINNFSRIRNNYKSANMIYIQKQKESQIKIWNSDKISMLKFK